ncbi:uncharacterized protein LOC132760433 isoform X1 [Ruditapes philippinarum]|uniref:uncharacterized protein LOC132760433 isoform X1 n=1 Tax=Ruditapes philippinarum TaxID=129788 RepID=UPI00295C0208|nr:uncharacterized protein LOC132760433 isoform X1 [Ruditapes philippinarum]
MSAVPVAEFLKDPSSWVAQPGCECRSAGVGIVNEVVPLYTAGTGGSLPGLTSEETAILAGVLTGLATFLFLLLPILCCLCPLPWACCGCGKKKAAAAGAGHRHGNIARSDASFWSTGSWGKGDKMDYDHLYGVDMKLPRPWVDNSSNHFDSKLHHDGGWEGADMTRDEIDAAIRSNGAGGESEIAAQSGIVTYASGEGGHDNAGYSSAERSRGGGDEVITEYTTTRRVDMHIGAMNPEEAEGYYTQTYGHYEAFAIPRYRRADLGETVFLEHSPGEMEG